MINYNDIEHEDYQVQLPLEVPVPEWVREDEDVTLPVDPGTSGRKVTGHLNLRALLPNDVLVTGTLVYRGNEYHVRYEHTTDAGDPYVYDSQGNNRQVLTDVPAEGFWHYRASQFVGGAPKTFVAPLMAAVKATVQDYIAHNPGHVRKCREANLIQEVNRKASDYNRKATEAAKALDAYETAEYNLAAFQGGES